MKIGILTQPLHNNYGGLMQAYALQTVLRQLGHNTYIVQREYPKTPFLRTLWEIHILNIARFILRKKLLYHVTENDLRTIRKNTQQFVDKEINPKTEKLYTDNELKKCVDREQFEAYVVGSDQVWRKAYSPNIGNYYLDFCENNDKVKKLSYAASFGTDRLDDYAPEEVERCKTLVQLFDGISVRESSGVEIVKSEFGKEATHVLDPTLLLEKEHYQKLIEGKNVKNNEGKIFYYILDRNVNTTNAIELIVKEEGNTSFTISPELPLNDDNIKNNINKCIYPGVYEWIKAFDDAKTVITDSFHGCVFSIIFNKPFWVFVNNSRGSARIESLLGMFGLEDRIINIHDFDIDKFGNYQPIDWKRVNYIKKNKQKESVEFLTKVLVK